MKISDGIREWVNKPEPKLKSYVSLLDLAERIDAEMVELPKDADGVPIHVGDGVWTTDGSKAFVTRICILHESVHVKCGLSGSGIIELLPSELTHKHPDTFERIADELQEWSETVNAPDNREVFDRAAEFADRIRKLEAKKEA